MKEEEIRRLIKIVEESNIGQLEVSRWGRTIKITKFPQNSQAQTNSSTTQAYAVPLSQPAPQQGPVYGVRIEIVCLAQKIEEAAHVAPVGATGVGREVALDPQMVVEGHKKLFAAQFGHTPPVCHSARDCS